MTGQLASLTGLRFVAAFWVMLFHLSHFASASSTTPGGGANLASQRLLRIIEAGPAGVTLFFVLSGFILTYRYHAQVRSATFDYRAFLVARFARIYPVYALGLLLGVAPWLASIDWVKDSPMLAAQKVIGIASLTILLAQSWFSTIAHRWNSVGWSLSVEAFFYISFIFLAPALLRRSSKTLVVLAIVAFGYATGVGAMTQIGQSSWTGYVYYHPVVRISDFLIGMVTGCLYVRSRSGTTASGRFPGAPAVTTTAIITILLFTGDVPRVFLDNSLWSPLFALLIYQLAVAENGRSILASPVAVRLGEASYSLYLLHYLLYALSFTMLARLGAEVSWVAASVVTLMIIGVSLLVLRHYEEPARRWIVAKFNPARRGHPDIFLQTAP